MKTPADSQFPGFTTPVLSNGKQYFVGLFSDTANPQIGASYPAMLRKEADGTWTEIDWRQPMWKDQQQDFDPTQMMNFIIDDFNITLAKEIAEAGGDPNDLNQDGLVEWVEKLARFFISNLRVVDDRLVFTV